MNQGSLEKEHGTGCLSPLLPAYLAHLKLALKLDLVLICGLGPPVIGFFPILCKLAKICNNRILPPKLSLPFIARGGGVFAHA